MTKIMINPQDKATHAIVNKFCNHVFHLKQVHYIICELFNKDDARSLLERTAPAFFIELNKILIDYFLLEIAKLTDPATSIHGRHENFSLSNLVETIEWPPDCINKIKELNNTVLSFRKYIEPARHKLLAHYDKKVVVSSIVLGSFPEGEEKKLLEALVEICNVMHKAAFGKIFGDMVTSHSGDVFDFMDVLKRAIAFDLLFSKSKGDDLVLLCNLLDGIDSELIYSRKNNY
jgi:hypothetical protein